VAAREYRARRAARPRQGQSIQERTDDGGDAHKALIGTLQLALSPGPTSRVIRPESRMSNRRGIDRHGDDVDRAPVGAKAFHAIRASLGGGADRHRARFAEASHPGPNRKVCTQTPMALPAHQNPCRPASSGRISRVENEHTGHTMLASCMRKPTLANAEARMRAQQAEGAAGWPAPIKAFARNDGSGPATRTSRRSH